MMADDIATKLQTSSIGTIGTDIFIGHMPDAPDNCIALMQNGGDPPEVVGGITSQIEYPRLIVRVRNTSYSAGMSKANSILKALHTVGDTNLSSHRYLFIRAIGSINQLGRDHENRSLFSIDFAVTKEMD